MFFHLRKKNSTEEDIYLRSNGSLKSDNQAYKIINKLHFLIYLVSFE